MSTTTKTLTKVGKGYEYAFLQKKDRGFHTAHNWNPIKGCKNLADNEPCSDPDGEPYCYLHRMQERFGIKNLPKKPTFYPELLGLPGKLKKPSVICCGTSGDMFSSTVPFDWLDKIFEIIFTCSKHFYLFLTKFPKTNIQYYLEEILQGTIENVMFGTTITRPSELWRAEELFKLPKGIKKYILFEPFYFNADFNDYNNCKNFVDFANADIIDWSIQNVDWIIMGAQTGKNAEKWTPSLKILKYFVDCATHYNIPNTPLFMKSSLKDVWEGDLIRQYPDAILQWAKKQGLEVK